MENVTSNDSVETKADAIAGRVISDNLIKHLVSTAKEASSTDEEFYRKLVEETWAKATRPSKRRKRITELLGSSRVEQAQLADRVAETQIVIANTMRKMSFGVPESFTWARWGGASNFSVHREALSSRSWSGDLTASLLDGRATYSPELYLRFNGGPKGERVEIPFKYLHGDVVGIAQWVRKESAKFAEETKRKDIAAIKAKRSEAQSTLSKLAEEELAVAERKTSKPARAPRPPKPADVA